MRRDLRPTNAKCFGVGFADRRIWTKSKLDRLFEVDGEIDVTPRTVDFRLDFLQRVSCRTATAHGADQVPLHVEDSRTRRAETRFQGRPTGLLPLPREF